MTGFSIDWLDLREAADRCARNDKLLHQARNWLGSDRGQTADLNMVDLGAGTGSTLRAFTTTVESDQKSLSWHLLDQDAALLAEATSRHGASHRLQTYELDITNISALPLEDADLITASALFDLVSADFIDTLATALQNRCQQKAVGLYAALNYDGITLWTPTHSLDQAVLDAFNRDQRSNKGFGLALGPDAGPYMELMFSRSGFSVFSANSPWVLDGADIELVDALIDGIGDAVAQDPALDGSELKDWILFRKAHSLTGTCEVRHTDLLALPDTV